MSIVEYVFMCPCGRYFEDKRWHDADLLKKLYLYRISQGSIAHKKLYLELCDNCRTKL
jgi:hypothetical protein